MEPEGSMPSFKLFNNPYPVPNQLFKIYKYLTYLIIVFPLLFKYLPNAKYVVDFLSIPPKPTLIFSYNFVCKFY